MERPGSYCLTNQPATPAVRFAKQIVPEEQTPITKGNTTLLSILYGILSAASWGAADFIGGIATKRTSAYRVLFLAEIAGLLPFTALALLTREKLPPTFEMLLGAGP